MKKISVIIPVYHTAGTILRKCIKSICEQTYDNLEIIIIDDGNADSYQYILKELEKSDPRIQVIHQDNAGVSMARNKGIEKATGEYLSFVDSDDYLDCAFYTKMMAAIQNNDVAICGVGDLYSSYPTEAQWCDRRLFFSQPCLYDGVQYVNFPVNKLFITKIIKENKIQFPKDIKLGEDALFVDEYFKYCDSFQIIPDIIYHYVYSEQSAVHTYQEDYWKWEKQVIIKQWEMFHQYALSESQEQAMAAWLFIKLRGAAYYYLSKEKNKNKSEEYLNEILSFPLFSILKKNHNLQNRYLTRREKLSIWLWNAMGKYGIRLTYQYRKIVSRFQ